jgi:hypothetical protein
MNDLARLYRASDQVQRWRAENENASARLILAEHEERIATLLSQHEPVATLGLDREKLRIALAYISHGDMDRLRRNIKGQE